jgi:hypothetical protein
MGMSTPAGGAGGRVPAGGGPLPGLERPAGSKKNVAVLARGRWSGFAIQA